MHLRLLSNLHMIIIADYFAYMRGQRGHKALSSYIIILNVQWQGGEGMEEGQYAETGN